MVMTARHLPISTLFLAAIWQPSAAALATAQICGRQKQVVTLVGIDMDVMTLTTSTPCVLAGTFTITLGAMARSSCASTIIFSVSVMSRGSNCPEM